MHRDFAGARWLNPYLFLASTFLFRRAESTEIQNPSRRLSIVTEVSPPTVNNGRLWIGRKTTHTQFPPNSRQSPTPAFKTIIRTANIVWPSVGEDLPPSGIAPINATSTITIESVRVSAPSGPWHFAMGQEPRTLAPRATAFPSESFERRT